MAQQVPVVPLDVRHRFFFQCSWYQNRNPYSGIFSQSGRFQCVTLSPVWSPIDARLVISFLFFLLEAYRGVICPEIINPGQHAIICLTSKYIYKQQRYQSILNDASATASNIMDFSFFTQFYLDLIRQYTLSKDTTCLMVISCSYIPISHTPASVTPVW